MKNSPDTQRILLDTSFLLPSLGIEVEKGVMDTLRKLEPTENELVYSDWSLLESNWIAVRQMRKGIFNESVFRRGLLSITRTGYYTGVTSKAEDYLMALTFVQDGHPDMIDNLLYATALRRGYSFLTIDRDLQDFVTRNNVQNVLLTPDDI
ncbi:hypothetical protein EU546_02425 [Candidatus Thorarchaeota archaeon]|nr:MAG: hypothetical protein EU546_02425 [Candidatus Thorarchaeota archaeon]